MGKLKQLASDTVVYGASTVLGRVLNWLLMPFYVDNIVPAEYGISVGVYAAISVLLVVYSLSLETGYFRFVKDDNKDVLYSTLSTSVLSFSVFCSALIMFFSDTMCGLLEISTERWDIVALMLLIVIVDAYNSLYFAELRYEKHGTKYALLRLLQVVITVLLNIFFIKYLRFADGFGSFGDMEYILLGNLIGSASTLLFFLPGLIRRPMTFDMTLLRSVLWYCLPLIGMGFFGMLNQNIEKMMLTKLLVVDDALEQLAYYGANYKIGVLMAIFTQSFRLAFEPFFFKMYKTDKKDVKVYGQTMKYYVYFGMLIFVGVMTFMPLANKIWPEAYCQGNVVIPYVLLSQLFFGIYYNLSIWYKVTDKTYFGLIFSVIGLTVNTISLFCLVPAMGIAGAAISTLVGYSVMMLLSIVLGGRYYYIPYQWGRYIAGMAVAVGCVALDKWLGQYVTYWVSAPLAIVLFLVYVFVADVRKMVRR